MTDAHNPHSSHFLTQPVEELTSENDPESWASFQRALAKWKAKCASEETAHSNGLLAERNPESSGSDKRLERFG